MPMEYTRKVTDLDTGETKWLPLGEHLTLTEAATRFGVGPRKFREALLHLGLLSREMDDRGEQHRCRLTPEAVRSGFGLRHDRFGLVGETERHPFDVLSPLGMDYVKDHLPAALAAFDAPPEKVTAAVVALAGFERERLSSLSPEMRAAWVADHFPALAAGEVAAAIGVSRQLVERYLKRRKRQLEEAMARRGLPGRETEGPATCPKAA